MKIYLIMEEKFYDGYFGASYAPVGAFSSEEKAKKYMDIIRQRTKFFDGYIKEMEVD